MENRVRDINIEPVYSGERIITNSLFLRINLTI